MGVSEDIADKLKVSIWDIGARVALWILPVPDLYCGVSPEYGSGRIKEDFSIIISVTDTTINTVPTRKTGLPAGDLD